MALCSFVNKGMKISVVNVMLFDFSCQCNLENVGLREENCPYSVKLPLTSNDFLFPTSLNRNLGN